MKSLIISFFLLVSVSAFAQEYTYPHKDCVPLINYENRRAKALESVPQNMCVLIFSGDFYESNSLRNKFRQNGWFYYFTGIAEPEMALILYPAGINLEGKIRKEIILFDEPSEDYIRWNGPSLSHKLARTQFGIDKAGNISELKSILKKISAKTNHILLLPPADLEQNPLYNFQSEFIKELEAKGAEISQQSISLYKLRGVKEPEEIACIQKAVDISCDAFQESIRKLKQLKNEREIEALMEYNFRKGGAEFPAFTSIIGSGSNSTYYHYTKNNKELKMGDLILMDCGAQYCGYSSDITRTVPYSGKFTQEQRIIYNIVLEAHKKAVETAKPGAQFMDTHLAASNFIADRLIELGIIKEKKDHVKHFNHGVSHYLGIDAHDFGDYGPLKEGEVITIEPGIYINSASDCDPKWHNIGIRIEDDILITKDGAEILSKSLPRTAEEIEKLMENEE